MRQVRGLGVRGLGEKQREEIEQTEAKIVSFLRVSPFTYEQLREISRIHRNALRIRLDSLVREKIVITHRYSIPYEYEYYGYMYRYPVSYRRPLYNHVYYLLNMSNDIMVNIRIEELLGLHSIKSRKKTKQTIRKTLNTWDGPMFSPALRVIALTHEGLHKSLKDSEKGRFSPSEFGEAYRRFIKSSVYLSRCIRENNLDGVKRGTYLKSRPIQKDILKKLINVYDFLIKRKFSLFDVFIRCCTEMIISDGGHNFMGNERGSTYIQMVNYDSLWYPLLRYKEKNTIK